MLKDAALATLHCTKQRVYTVDNIKLNGKVEVLLKGNMKTGHKRPLFLYKRGDDPHDFQRDGQPVGRLLLVNINMMVHAKSALVQVNMQAWSMLL